MVPFALEHFMKIYIFIYFEKVTDVERDEIIKIIKRNNILMKCIFLLILSVVRNHLLRVSFLKILSHIAIFINSL